MWHKDKWIGYPIRLEFPRVGLLVYLANHYTNRGAPGYLVVIYKAFCLYMAQGCKNGVPVILELTHEGLLV